MSCPPLFQQIRFLAVCTLDRFVFQISYLVFCRGNGVFAPFPRFSFMRIGERVYTLLSTYTCVRDAKRGI